MPTAEKNAALAQMNNNSNEDLTVPTTSVNDFIFQNRSSEFDAWTRELPSNEKYTAMH